MACRGRREKDFKQRLISFGKESGLFSDIIVHELGDDATAPFELLVEVKGDCAPTDQQCWLRRIAGDSARCQMLTRDKGSWFAIQQPEVHLHPRAQAAIGELLFDMAEARHQKYLVETHSDFTIDRFRIQFRNNPEAPRPRPR